MSQFDCLDPKAALYGHHVLEASAGTGKTFAIEHLVTRFILDGKLLSEILVVTFTRAATRDLKRRIFSNLLKVLDMLSGVKEDLFPYVLKALMQKELSILRIKNAISQIDDAEIFTIHSFCHRMLSEFAFDAKIGFGQEKFEETAILPLISAEVHKFFRHQLSTSLYSRAQLKALFQAHGENFQKLERALSNLILLEGTFPKIASYRESYAAFVLELAALKGKDLLADFYKIAPYYKGITNRQSQVLEKWETQVEILAKMIEHQSCSEEEFDQLLWQSPLFLSLLTDSQLKKNAEIRKPPYFEKITTLLKEAIAPLNTLVRIAKDCRENLDVICLKEEIYPPDQILKQMQKRLIQPSFTRAVQEKYQVAIIDEFQDTDPIQWNIFHTLFHAAKAFYLVGDPKQSIYAFRGADLNTYLKATSTRVEKKYLDTNHRSQPAVIDALNALFSKETLGNWLEEIEFRKVNSKKDAINTNFGDGKEALHFFAAKGKRGREKKWPTAVMEEEMLFPFIAKEMMELKSAKKAVWSDFAILVNDRFQAKRLFDFLVNLGIPAVTKADKLLKETLSFSLFEALLGAAFDPYNKSASIELLAHPFYGHSHTQLKEESLQEVAITLVHQLSRVFQKEGFSSFIKGFLESSLNPKQETEDFFQITELLLDYNTQGSLQEYLEYLTEVKELLFDQDGKYKRKGSKSASSATIMTVHMSKGLEFEIVFALGLISRHASHAPIIKQAEELIFFERNLAACKAALQNADIEKMRKLYVALTRAKKRVYVPLLYEVEAKEIPLGHASPIDLLQQMLQSNSLTIKDLVKSGCSFTELDKEEFYLERLTDRNLAPSALISLIPPHFQKKQMLSFTSLSSKLPQVFRSEIDLEKEIPLGALTGTIIHTLFEKFMDAGRYHPFDPMYLRSLVEKMIVDTHLEGWGVQIYEMMETAFHVNLTDTFCLVDVPPNRIITEMEFLFPFSHDYLKGFADLIFQVEGKYYILDWKTNYLEGYTKEHLEAAMDQGDYFKQGQIYVHALKKYLEMVEKRPFSECFGGVFYLFVRGLKQGGVYFGKERFSNEFSE